MNERKFKARRIRSETEHIQKIIWSVIATVTWFARYWKFPLLTRDCLLRSTATHHSENKQFDEIIFITLDWKCLFNGTSIYDRHLVRLSALRLS